MLYYLWRFLGRCFWIKLTSHWSQPKTKHRYFSEWEQKRNRIRNQINYKLVGSPNPKEQEA